jgi:hypothetical protein
MAWLALTTRWHAKSSAIKGPNTFSKPSAYDSEANDGYSDHTLFGRDRAIENAFQMRKNRAWFWVPFFLLVCCTLVLPDDAVLSLIQATRSMRHSCGSQIPSQLVDCWGRNVEPSVPPPEKFSDNGRTKEVQWDSYSLIVKGQRIFLQYVKHMLSDSGIKVCFSSGEFHTFRLPVPSLWPDILQKIKAAGLNAISVYTHMGLINPSRGVLDFHGFRALHPLFEAAKESGLWIVLRPGLHEPYLNDIRLLIALCC